MVALRIRTKLVSIWDI